MPDSQAGGVWTASRRYPGLTTQNPRVQYELSDFPMPSDWPEWPNGEQVQHYMQSYVEHYDFGDDIYLNSEIIRADYDESREKWQVTVHQTTDGGQSSEITREFDYLIVANGIFSIPFIPEFPGLAEYEQAGGKICYTSEFTQPEQARGRNVLIIGYGKSSCDVAAAIKDSAASTTVVARHLIWKMPKLIFNRINFKHLFLTRMSEALFRYIRLRGADKFFHTIGSPIRIGMLKLMEFIIERQLGLRDLGLHPNKPLETIARSTVSLVTPGFFPGIKSGAIKMQKNVEIKELRPGEAVLSNGEVLPVDLIVSGTGWKQRCDFLPQDIMNRVTDERGNFRLYRSILPIGVPRLAFNGYNSSFFSQLNCEIGALWLVDYLNAGVELPSLDAQNQYADERLAWMEKRTDGKHSSGTNIIPFSIHHIDELLDEMNMNLSAMQRFKQWFTALQPEDYADILPRLKAKHRG